MIAEMVTAEIESILADSSLTSEDRLFWIDVLNRTPFEARVYFIKTFSDNPELLPLATENTKLKMGVMAGKVSQEEVYEMEKKTLEEALNNDN